MHSTKRILAMALMERPHHKDQLFSKDFDYFNRKRRGSLWLPPEILKRRDAVPIQYMKPETRAETARALWAVGIRKAKIMSDIMRAFNLIERDIYIRGAQAKIDFTMYEKRDENLVEVKVN